MDNRIIKNYFYNILYQVFILLVPLILSPYLARVLGVNSIGVYSYIHSISNIIITFTLLGTYSYGVREIAYNRDNKEYLTKLFWQIFNARLILGFIGSCFYFILAYFHKDYILYLITYYPWFLAMIIDTSWFFVGIEDMKSTAIKNFFIKFLSVLLIFIFVKNYDDLSIYILIMAISSFIANFALFFQLKKYIKFSKEKLGITKDHILKSLDLFWPIAASTLYIQVNKIILQQITQDTSQLTFYDYGEKLVTIPLTFITMLSTVMMPRIANEFNKNNNSGMKKLLIKAGEISLFLSIPMSFGLAIISKDLIPWYLGDSFIPTALCVILLSPLIVINSLLGISGNQYLIATNQTKILLRAYLTAGISNILINIFLIPYFGYIGSAIATIISSIISLIIQFRSMNKQIDISKFLIYGIKYTLLVIPMCIVTLSLERYLPSVPFSTILEVIIGFITYAITLFIYKDELLLSIIKSIKNSKKIKSFN